METKSQRRKGTKDRIAQKTAIGTTVMNDVKIVIPNERPVSWNKIYESRHWIFRKNLATSVHRKVINVLDQMGYQPLDKTKMFDQPVAIMVTAYFKDRPLDADNIGAKLYIDALKFICILDDGPKYVTAVTTKSRVDRLNPRVEIDIKEARYERLYD